MPYRREVEQVRPMTIDSMERIELTQACSIGQLISNDLVRMEELMLDQVMDFHPDMKQAARLILSSGGKRLRPRIILLTGRMLGAPHEALVTLAASIELLHNATLVHDDFIDGALLRRGIATLNANWSPAATILAGDFLFASASALAAKTNSVKIMHLFSQTLMTIVNGEVNQLFSANTPVDMDGYYRRIYAKTASLFETCSLSAAMLAGADQSRCDALRRYGRDLGMAFQIVDDILDYTGSEISAGKPVGGDLRQGLVTLPLLCHLKEFPQDELVMKMRGESLSEKEVSVLYSRVVNGNAIRHARETAGDFICRAQTCLREAPDGQEKDALSAIAGGVLRSV